MTSSMVTMMGKLAGDEYINDQCWTEINAPSITPNFLVRFLSNFDKELKGFLPLAGKNYYADAGNTKAIFDWEPTPIRKTILDTAAKISSNINDQSGRGVKR
ncbi:MAG: hypothetical protein HRU40_12260 [Saprospiraceae bacterium]|nr:hypothetical protein [Saprospiraceae bacterium]